MCFCPCKGTLLSKDGKKALGRQCSTAQRERDSVSHEGIYESGRIACQKNPSIHWLWFPKDQR